MSHFVADATFIGSLRVGPHDGRVEHHRVQVRFLHSLGQALPNTFWAERRLRLLFRRYVNHPDSTAADVLKPHEVTEAVAWLCRLAASFTTGQCFLVDGGRALALPKQERALDDAITNRSLAS